MLYKCTPEGLVLKLCDLGFACRFDEQEQWEMRCGTIGYCAPELFKAGCQVSSQSDDFALGIVLFELLTGKHAKGAGRGACVPSLSVVPLSQAFSRSCLVLLAGLMHTDLDMRWSAAGALGSEWLGGPRRPAGKAGGWRAGACR